MSILITTFAAEADALLQSADVGNELNTPTRYQRVRAALAQYALDFPSITTEDVTGTGGQYYPLTGGSAVLTQWADNISNVKQIEYPAVDVTGAGTPQYLEPGTWLDDYEAGGVTYLYLRNTAPSAAEEMRVTYTTRYAWEASSTTTDVNQDAHGFSADDYIRQDSAGDWEAATVLTGTHQVTAVADADNFTAATLEIDVPTNHFDALCSLIACHYCNAIATKYSRTNDSTINADAVDHPSRATRFVTMADRFCSAYRKMVGLGTSGAGGQDSAARPSGSFIDLDTQPRYPTGRRYLTHRRR